MLLELLFTNSLQSASHSAPAAVFLTELRPRLTHMVTNCQNPAQRCFFFSSIPIGAWIQHFWDVRESWSTNYIRYRSFKSVFVVVYSLSTSVWQGGVRDVTAIIRGSGFGYPVSNHGRGWLYFTNIRGKGMTGLL